MEVLTKIGKHENPPTAVFIIYIKTKLPHISRNGSRWQQSFLQLHVVHEAIYYKFYLPAVNSMCLNKHFYELC